LIIVGAVDADRRKDEHFEVGDPPAVSCLEHTLRAVEKHIALILGVYLKPFAYIELLSGGLPL